MLASHILPCRSPADVLHCSMLSKELARSCGFARERAEAIACAASELARNAIQHGGGGHLLIQISAEPKAGLSLICTDRGGAQEEGRSLRRTGRGLAIVSAVMDEVTFRRLGTGGLLVVGFAACPALSEWPTLPIPM